MLVNQGLTCIGTTFKNCVSSNGGGGSIFIYNKDPAKTNKVSFKNLVIQSCEALFGGGAFIYSISEESVVMIESCRFISNSINKEGKNGLVGGSALYLFVKDGQVNDCFFSKNKGGSIIKVSNNFDTKPEESYMMMLQKDVYSSSVLINKCSFELSENSTGSLLYYVEKQTSQIDVDDYFANEINGIKTKSDQLNDDLKRELNSKFIEFNSDNPVSQKKKEFVVEMRNSTKLLLVVVSFGLIVLIISIITISKRNNENDLSNDFSI